MRLPLRVRLGARVSLVELPDGRQALVYKAWWLPLYTALLVAFCRVTGLDPDMGRVAAVLDRALRVHYIDQ